MTIYNLKFKIYNFQSGMSLMEVIVTMFLLSVLLAFYIAALNTVTITKKLTYEDLAYHAANKQMEILRNTAFASLPTSGTITDSQLTRIPSGSGSFTISNYPGYSGEKEIVVTV